MYFLSYLKYKKADCFKKQQQRFIHLFNVSFLNTLPNKPPGCFKTKHSDQLIFIGHESIVNSDCLCEWECLAISFAVT